MGIPRYAVAIPLTAGQPHVSMPSGYSQKLQPSARPLIGSRPPPCAHRATGATTPFARSGASRLEGRQWPGLPSVTRQVSRHDQRVLRCGEYMHRLDETNQARTPSVHYAAHPSLACCSASGAEHRVCARRRPTDTASVDARYSDRPPRLARCAVLVADRGTCRSAGHDTG